jgi:glutamate:Na+ symporter, ESS family
VTPLKLDAIQTLGFAAIVLAVGYVLRARLRPLARLNIPAPVIGGLLVSVFISICRLWDFTPLELDTTWQSPLMIAFFTTVGFGASFGLLKRGGPQVAMLLAICSVFIVLQNVVGAGLAMLLGQPPLLGVLAGSVTLAGGPATGAAFAPLFEEAGIKAAGTVALAAAMAGIVLGGLLGGPLGTWLIERHRLGKASGGPVPSQPAAQVVEDALEQPTRAAPQGEDAEAYGLMQTVGVILVAMWLGSFLSAWLKSLGVTLPAYIGAMVVAVVFRNVDEKTKWLKLSQRLIDDVGTVALAFFLVQALMTLKLWELRHLALPLMVLLVVQTAIVAAATPFLVFKLMGKDYDAAVMGAGFTGFMLGTTANAMANMESLAEKYGPAPRAFLVVPMVGAFFVDVVNNLAITAAINLLR